MVSFQCDECTDVVKKPKLDNHYYKCHASFTCVDCSKTFGGPKEWKGHTSCISEAEKYQKGLYKGKKGDPYGRANTKADNQPAKPTTPAVSQPQAQAQSDVTPMSTDGEYMASNFYTSRPVEQEVHDAALQPRQFVSSGRTSRGRGRGRGRGAAFFSSSSRSSYTGSGANDTPLGTSTRSFTSVSPPVPASPASFECQGQINEGGNGEAVKTTKGDEGPPASDLQKKGKKKKRKFEVKAVDESTDKDIAQPMDVGDAQKSEDVEKKSKKEKKEKKKKVKSAETVPDSPIAPSGHVEPASIPSPSSPTKADATTPDKKEKKKRKRENDEEKETKVVEPTDVNDGGKKRKKKKHAGGATGDVTSAEDQKRHNKQNKDKESNGEVEDVVMTGDAQDVTTTTADEVRTEEKKSKKEKKEKKDQKKKLEV